VIVGNFHVGRTFIAPRKAQTPLTVDADAVLAEAITFQRFESVAWRRLHRVQRGGVVQLRQAAHCHVSDVGESGAASSFEKLPRVFAFERLDHGPEYMPFTGKRQMKGCGAEGWHLPAVQAGDGRQMTIEGTT
jgi:hypothetical protein